MFVPNSGALWLAINSKPDLWRRAMERNVFIADEQTLFAALKIIRMTWTQIAQAQNHKECAGGLRPDLRQAMERTPEHIGNLR